MGKTSNKEKSYLRRLSESLLDDDELLLEPQSWEEIVKSATLTDIIDYLASRGRAEGSQSWIDCWTAAFNAYPDKRDMLIEATEGTVTCLNIIPDGEADTDLLLQKALQHELERGAVFQEAPLWRDWLTSCLISPRWPAGSWWKSEAKDQILQVARTCMDHDTASNLITHHANDLVDQLRDMLPILVTHAAGELAAQLKKRWLENGSMKTSLEDKLRGVLSRCGNHLMAPMMAEFSFESALHEANLSWASKDDTIDWCARFLSQFNINLVNKVDKSFRVAASIWRAFLRLEQIPYSSHNIEELGINSQIEKLARENPDVWTACLPLIICKTDRALPLVVSITVQMADGNKEILNNLRAIERSRVSPVCDRARGILTLLQDPNTVRGDINSRVLSALARHLDGRPAFPHPLKMRSSTWLASEATERIIRDGIQRAENQFARFCLRSLDSDEETLSGRLLDEIEFAFREENLAVATLGESSQGNKIKVSRRMPSKREEGKKDDPRGFDIAFLLRSQIKNILEIESAELVQVKKALRDGKSGYRDSWAIKFSQMQIMIQHSQTASYWMIGTEGEIFVVPARLLKAIAKGREITHQGSMTVSYADIRSMCIPISQFLVDLFVGVWIGTGDDEALEYARGKSRTGQPWQIFEIDVRSGRDEQS